MKTKEDINSRLGKVVEESKGALEGKDSDQKKRTKRVISKMNL